MVYRLALVEDYPAIADYVHSRDYFMPVDPCTLGGTWVLAEHNGIVHGVIWFFHNGANAYVDYWAGSTARIAARLGVIAQRMLEAVGVHHVRGMVAGNNPRALRLATEGMGMVASGVDYKLVYKRV